MHNHSHENELNLHENEISFSYETMDTKTRFEKEAKGNSEIAYCFTDWYLGRKSFTCLHNMIRANYNHRNRRI